MKSFEEFIGAFEQKKYLDYGFIEDDVIGVVMSAWG